MKNSIYSLHSYGSPRSVVSEKYEKFADWYLPTFTQGVLEVMLKILDQYRNRIYVSPRVLSDVLAYLKNASVFLIFYFISKEKKNEIG